MRVTGYGLTVLVPDPDAERLIAAGLVNRSSAYPRRGWPTSYRAAVELADKYPPLPIFNLSNDPREFPPIDEGDPEPDGIQPEPDAAPVKVNRRA